PFGSDVIRNTRQNVKALGRSLMRALVTSYLAAALVMGVLDFIWLRATVNPIYQPALSAVLAEKPNMPAAIAFYLVYLAGVLIFAIRPALADGDWKTALVKGALFGLFAYATYDLTNLATLKVWSLKISLMDIAWGTVLTAAAASAGAAAAERAHPHWPAPKPS
ncbi:MAG: DUF2177 family protein, partial [Terriglobales bacterium]